MITQYIKGDIVALFRAGNHIAHGCNCMHLMGAGVAGQLAQAYPIILRADKGLTDYADAGKLGSYSRAVTIGPDDREIYCFNLYTQYKPGRNLDYGALVNCMIELNEWGKNQIAPPKIYMPRIGCGIAGGDWAKVNTLINMFTPNLNIVIVDWDGE